MFCQNSIKKYALLEAQKRDTVDFIFHQGIPLALVVYIVYTVMKDNCYTIVDLLLTSFLLIICCFCFFSYMIELKNISNEQKEIRKKIQKGTNKIQKYKFTIQQNKSLKRIEKRKKSYYFYLFLYVFSLLIYIFGIKSKVSSVESIFVLFIIISSFARSIYNLFIIFEYQKIIKNEIIILDKNDIISFLKKIDPFYVVFDVRCLEPHVVSVSGFEKK